MEKKLKDKDERVFTVASLYDSVSIANRELKDNNLDFRKGIIEEKRLELKFKIIADWDNKQTELKEKIDKAKGSKREKLQQELQNNNNDFEYFMDESSEPKLIPLFTLQQNELVYLPTSANDEVLSLSANEFNDWIRIKDNKMAFCNRVYKVVKIDNPGLCHFIPHNYANHIRVSKNLSKREIDKLKKEQDEKGKKGISKKDLNFIEFGSFGNCSPYEPNDDFVNYLANGYKGKPKRIQDECIKINIDWLGNISKI